MDHLDDVLAAGAIHSAFQPIVDLDSGRVVAYEALARGPEGALATPDALFAAARAGGRLAELDAACRTAAFEGAVAQGLLAPLTLFVNVEPEVLDSAPLDDLLAIASAAPGELRVVLEITERALAVRPADLLRTVERVRALGWGVALDDVGADVLSLAFMPLLRPDVVKLDLRLVQDRPGPQIAEIMNAVNAYAERSGALILAEGIETEAHLRTARALGARLGQGWLLGRPGAGVAPAGTAGELVLPAPPAADADGSPFDCLPPGTVLRRSPKDLLIELSKQLEREAMRIGKTCVVAATFQEARHFTVSTTQRYRDLVERTSFVCALGEDLPVEPVPGVRGADLSPDDPVRGRVGRRRHRPALRRRAARARPRGQRAGPAAHLRVRAHLRPGHRRVRGGRPARPGGTAGRAGRRRAERRRSSLGADVVRAAGRHDTGRAGGGGTAPAGARSDEQRRDHRRHDPPGPAARLRQRRLRAALGLLGGRAARTQLPLPAGQRHRPGRRRPHPRGHRSTDGSAGRPCSTCAAPTGRPGGTRSSSRR